MEKQILRHDTACRICKSTNVETVMHLKDTPLEDQFVSEQNKTVHQPVYALDLALCKSCGYLYLPYIVNPEVSYADYVYVSGVTVGLRDHYDEYAAQIVSEFKIPKESLVIDLGSNDGSMLASFKKIHMKVLGVEPARNISKLANESGIPTINDFFTPAVADKIVQEHGTAKAVTANYMYANIDDLLSFTKSVAKLLSPDGVFIVQTGYHPEQMKIHMFDYIYHEHFSYFTLDVLRNLFELCGLQLIKATKTKPKGGSIRAIAQIAGGAHKVDGSVAEIIGEEKKAGMERVDVYKTFDLTISNLSKKLRAQLAEFKKAGKKIVGFGASHSTTTLTYHFELAEYLDYLVDDNKLKHGHYSPGLHLPVYGTEKLYAEKPEVVIVLAWQHAGSILERHRSFLSTGGVFVLPLPDLKIVQG